MSNPTYTVILILLVLVSVRAQGSTVGKHVPARAQSNPAPARTPEPLEVGIVGGGGAWVTAEGLPDTLTPSPTVTATESVVQGVASEAPQSPQSSVTVTQALQQYSAPAPTVKASEPTSATLSGQSSLEAQVYAAVQAYFPASEWAKAMRVAYCESRYEPTAVESGGHHVGVWQVDPDLHGSVPADIWGQTEQAYRVWIQQGWGAWSCQ